MKYYCSDCRKKFDFIPDSNKNSFEMVESLSQDVRVGIEPSISSFKDNLQIVENGKRWTACPDCSKLVEQYYYMTMDRNQYKETRAKFFGKKFEIYFKRLKKQENQALEIMELIELEEAETEKKEKKKKEKQQEFEKLKKEATRTLRTENVINPPVLIYNRSSIKLIMDFLISKLPRAHDRHFNAEEVDLSLQILFSIYPDISNLTEKYQSFLEEYQNQDSKTQRIDFITMHIEKTKTQNNRKNKNTKNVKKCSICGFRLSPKAVKAGKTICIQCQSNQKEN